MTKLLLKAFTLIFLVLTSILSIAQVNIFGTTSTLGICTDDGMGKLIPNIRVQENQLNNIGGNTHDNFQISSLLDLNLIPTCNHNLPWEMVT